MTAALVLGLAASLPAWANTYRWVDERGRVYYSDKPPLHAVEPDVLDRQGRVLRKSRPPAPDNNNTGVRDLARERLDQALLSTYVNETEIDLARERALAQERAKQASLESLLEQARARKARLEGEAGTRGHTGRMPPAGLSQALAESEREIARLETLRARSANALREIEVRYEGYKRRFRELKGLPAEAPANGSPPTVGDVKP